MDGWGLGQKKDSDAIANANTPFTDSLYLRYPNSTLVTYGTEVGLPEGQMGNSEVGHLNLGAGRIVYQDLERINVEVRKGLLQTNTVLNETLDYAFSNGKTLHLMGLLSDGGVHSHIEHLKALLAICAEKNLNNVLVHAFTDGRDTDPKSGVGYVQELLSAMAVSTGRLATVTGRYYAMDRDKRWERVKLAYDALVHGTGERTADFISSMENNYAQNITDEFLQPLVNSAVNDTRIKEGDAVICFNFRTDRCREITEVLTQEPVKEYDMTPLRLFYTTMTRYDDTFRDVHVMYEKDDLKNTIGEAVANAGKTQLRIAETEKYPHVSFFFSGGREEPFAGESRILVASPKVATYDLQPEMSAPEVTEKIVNAISTFSPDFICLNFANTDMVGHTGVWEAVIKAAETVDKCVQKVITAALEKHYTVFLLADHGNADFMINDDGTPNTAHTTNLVPFFVISNNPVGSLKNGKLGDVAPTILHAMGITPPVEMTGEILTA